MSKYDDKGSQLRELIVDPKDFMQLLAHEKNNIKIQYRDKPLEYLKERHNITFPPLLRWLFLLVYNRIKQKLHTKLIAKAPRGGGKSWWAHVVEFCVWFFLDGDAVNMGGGEDQAKIVYQYIDTLISSDPEVDAWCTKRKQSETRQRALDGSLPHPVIHCIPASMKQVRGKHPGGTRKSPGVLVLDEAAEMDDRIIDSALPMANTATPPVILVISTFHKIFGKFQHIWDQYALLGFIRVTWDIFDVCKRCFRNCDIEYTQDHDHGCLPEFRDKYCEVICDCYFNFNEHQGNYPKYKHNQCGRKCKKCGGLIDHKARKITDGWISIETIIEYRLVFDVETFEIEIMGWRPSSAGLVLNPKDVDDCVVATTQIQEGYPLKLGIDWGVRGQCGIILTQLLPNMRSIIDAWAFVNPSDTKIYNFLTELRLKTGVNDVGADSSHPFQNDHVRHELGFNLTEVNFSTEKERGVGALKKLFENHTWIIPANSDNDTSMLINQLKNWRRNKDTGKIIKMNDHLPDALLCTVTDVGADIPVIGAYGSNLIEPVSDRDEVFFESFGERAVGPFAEDY